MDIEEIYRRDLNLFIALRVLLEEGSVSKAATRLNLSQSAMSRVLGRLRVLTCDPLFTRHGQHLLPTSRALEINSALSAPLDALCSLFAPHQFNPAVCERRFSIATTDYAIQTILPFALPRIYEEAPKISLDFVPLQHDKLLQQLTHDGCDMAICRPTGIAPSLQSKVMGQVGVLCLLAKNHPCADKNLTMDDYLSYPHAVIAISDGVKTLLDDALRGYPAPKLVLRAYHLEAALAMVERLPLIITVPADLAYLVGDKYKLVKKPLPFVFKPFDYSLIWHVTSANSAEQSWLRNLIIEECGKLISRRVKDIGMI